MNQVASNLANALDKSTAGDAIAGTVTFVGTGKIRTSSSDQIEIANGNGLIVSAGSGIVTTGSGSITAASTSGINSAVANGIVPLVAGGVSDGGVVGGIAATVAGGIQSNIGGGIQPTVIGGITDGGISQGIVITASHGLATSGSGSIQLAAGASDWIRYATTRSTSRAIPLAPPGYNVSVGTGWTTSFASSPALVGGATGNNIIIPLNALMQGNVNGATLTGFSLIFAIGSSHSGQPASPISVGLFAQSLIAGTAPGATALLSGGMQNFPWPGLTTYYSSGNLQSFTPANQPNAVVNVTNNEYFVQLQDESSTNSIAGNLYYAVLLTYTAIANSAPG